MRNTRRTRARLMHGYRVIVFVALLGLIHLQHRWFVEQRRGDLRQTISAGEIREFFPAADRLGDWDAGHGGQDVFDAAGERLGHVLQTSPEADHVVGFSGPSNTLIAFDSEGRVLGLRVLRSDDTREHLKVVLKDQGFLRRWNGLTKEEAAALTGVDAVSGATLTSTAISDGIATRLGRRRTTERFPNPVRLDEVRMRLPEAARMEAIAERPGLFRVLDGTNGLIGFVTRTSPHADEMMGYQGPTDALLVLDGQRRLIGAATRSSYDNEPFVGYLEKDSYFYNAFVGFTLNEIGQLDPVDAGLDGVSGATKTSITVAEGIIRTAAKLSRDAPPPPQPGPLIRFPTRDVGTTGLLVFGLLVAFTRLRGSKLLRIILQAGLIGYLGFVNADMLSQALLVGWAQNGIAWRVAPGLVLLTTAALVAPILTGRQVFCTHICPYGAVQDLIAHRLPWKLRLSRWVDRILGFLPSVLLGVVVGVAMTHAGVSLVGIEPFDAFVPRVAGASALTIAVLGCLAGLWVPRAYCRYGCPTGAMLKFLRWNASGDQFGRGDAVAGLLLMMALILWIWR